MRRKYDERGMNLPIDADEPQQPKWFSQEVGGHLQQLISWSRRRESNRRHPAWEADVAEGFLSNRHLIITLAISCLFYEVCSLRIPRMPQNQAHLFSLIPKHFGQFGQ